MAIRPEAVSVDAPGAAALGNTLQGEIRLREFLGATIRLSIVTSLGNFSVRPPRTGRAARCQPGTAVQISWRAEDALLFPPR
jgi:hypothetical protein